MKSRDRREANKRKSVVWACLCLAFGSIGYLIFHNWIFLVCGLISYVLVIGLR